MLEVMRDVFEGTDRREKERCEVTMLGQEGGWGHRLLAGKVERSVGPHPPHIGGRGSSRYHAARSLTRAASLVLHLQRWRYSNPNLNPNLTV